MPNTVSSPVSILRLEQPWCDPERVFAVLDESYDDVFWLDSGIGASEGWSYLGSGVKDTSGPGETEIRAAAGEGFTGGWMGWYDYDSGARAAAMLHRSEKENADWLHVSEFIAVDHAAQRLVLVSRSGPAGIERMEAVLRKARRQDPPAWRENTADAVSVSARHTPEEYGALVEACREDIRQGTAYQLCLTTRFTVERPRSASAAYALLRRAQPSHHGGYLRIGPRTLLSASPERFLSVQDRRVLTEPIKGTRPRGTDEESDRALAEQLRGSEKERAENVMIVDLMRNDIGRVCEAGSVDVPSLLRVESYSQVHQLVSTVEGVIREGTRVDDLFSATFPAGSMTGAPKLSAMSVLRDREGGERGIYSGCFGWIDHTGRMDLAMVIRSLVYEGDSAYVGAGGGITWGSVGEEETAEAALKARAPLAAAGGNLPQEWARLVG